MPWVLRGGDFSTADWHVQPTAGFQLMFEFLRLSPSYELARKFRTKSLSKAEKLLLPSDFDQVLKTYDLIGDVSEELFRTWWLKRGLKLFGNPYKKPRVHQVATLNADEDIGAASLSAPLTNFLLHERRDEGLSPSVLLSVPIGGKRSDVIKQITQILKEQTALAIERKTQPKIKLVNKRLHANVMFKGLRLLWLKAAKPNWELWRLGAKANLSASYSGVLDPNAPKKTAQPLELDDRIIMSKITFRSLRKYELIAENAARGRFATDVMIEHPEFDYPAIASRLKARAVWVRTEKVRLRESTK